MPDNVYLADENGTADGHGHSDDGKIYARKIETPDANMFSSEDIPPQKTSQRRAKRCAECTIVDAERHAVHCCPECPIGDGDPIFAMDLLPFLNHSGEKDGGSDIRPCKLYSYGRLAVRVQYLLRTETHVTENHGEESHAANAANGSCLFHPMVPAVGEYRNPAFGDQRLHKNKHGEGKRNEQKRKVRYHRRKGRERLLQPPVRILDER